MTIDKEDLLNSILESLDRIHYIKLDDIPEYGQVSGGR